MRFVSFRYAAALIAISGGCALLAEGTLEDKPDVAAGGSTAQGQAGTMSQGGNPSGAGNAQGGAGANAGGNNGGNNPGGNNPGGNNPGGSGGNNQGGNNQGGMGGDMCPTDPNPPGMPPPPVTDPVWSCNPGLDRCTLDCDDQDECNNSNFGTIVCPPGWSCLVRCTGTAACKQNTIQCSDYHCNVECEDGTDACQDLTIDCGQATCLVECLGSTSTTCGGSMTVQCEPGYPCDMVCDSGAGSPSSVTNCMGATPACRCTEC